jgi:alkyl sulfatase BDS1-like metallo-beta-lactamase superfamily hydrolase
LCTGDLFIWATPNAGNPQKVQRYPGEWAAALRRMAGLGAEVLSPGHGVPIFGAARIGQALLETAAWLEHLEAGVLARMNDGAKLDQIVSEVTPPAELAGRPYLQPIYDEPEFVVRNLWRLYGGWYDGDPAHLKPPPEAELAACISSLAGGAAKLVERAEAAAQAGQLALACQLVEWARRAAPDDAAVRKARANIYATRAEKERSLMARGIFNAAAKD